MVLPGATEMEWRQYGDAWIDARELAAVAVTCLEQPLVAAANAINGHFIWYEFCIELIRLTGSTSSIMHKDLAAITAAELASKAFFANTWHYSGTYLQQCLQFQPTHCWQDTLKQAIENDG
jgi:hypothetical protein